MGFTVVRSRRFRQCSLAVVVLMLLLPDLHAQGRTYRLWGNQVSFFLPAGAKIEKVSALDYRIFFPDSFILDEDGNTFRNESVNIGRERSAPLQSINRRIIARYARQHAGDVDGFRLEQNRHRGNRIDLRYSHDTISNISPFYLRDRTQLRVYLRGRRTFYAALSGFEERWNTDDLRQLRRVVETFRAR